MPREDEIRTESGHIYYIKESGGWWYVRKPSWFPGGTGVGSARSRREALDLIEEDAGESIE